MSFVDAHVMEQMSEKQNLNNLHGLEGRRKAANWRKCGENGLQVTNAQIWILN